MAWRLLLLFTSIVAATPSVRDATPSSSGTMNRVSSKLVRREPDSTAPDAKTQAVDQAGSSNAHKSKVAAVDQASSSQSAPKATADADPFRVNTADWDVTMPYGVWLKKATAEKKQLKEKKQKEALAKLLKSKSSIDQKPDADKKGALVEQSQKQKQGSYLRLAAKLKGTKIGRDWEKISESERKARIQRHDALDWLARTQPYVMVRHGNAWEWIRQDKLLQQAERASLMEDRRSLNGEKVRKGGYLHKIQMVRDYRGVVSFPGDATPGLKADGTYSWIDSPDKFPNAPPQHVTDRVLLGD